MGAHRQPPGIRVAAAPAAVLPVEYLGLLECAIGGGRRRFSEVITTGPYRLIRHPGYAGAVLALAGFGIATGNAVSAAVFLVARIAVFSRTILLEEAALVARLGDPYRNYQRRTWHLVPRVW